MAPVSCENKVDAITNISTMVKLLDTLGISGEGLSSLVEMKDKVKEHLQEDTSSKWKAGQGFNVFANAKAQDVAQRSDLKKLYTEATKVLYKFGDEVGETRESQAGKIRELQNQLEVKEYVVLVAGETSAGKSSILNLILGEDLLPKAHLSSTSVICELKYGENCGMEVHFKNKSVKSFPFIEMDFEAIKQKIQKVVVAEGEAREKPKYEKVVLYWPHPLLKAGVQIVDSPGFGESDIMDDMVSKYLPNVFAFIYVINSANAGGVQKDRIIKLLDKVKKKLELSQAGFSSKSALFVFNKWDSIPQQEVEVVKEKTIVMLCKSLPELKPQTQVMHFSTTRAALAQEYGISSREFTTLLDSINTLVTRSMASRLEVHRRWLSIFIKKMISTADTFLVNADRSREETLKRMHNVRERLDLLQRDQAKDMEELDRMLLTKTEEATRRLTAHMNSDSFRRKFCSWKHSDGPPADMESWKETELKMKECLELRLKQLIQEWEEEEHVFAEARKSLINHFLAKYQHFGRHLARLRQTEMGVPVVRVPGVRQSDGDDTIDMIAVAVPGLLFLPLNLVASLLGGPAVALVENVKDEHPKVFWATSPLWAPFALVGAILAIPTGLTAIGIAFGARRVKETKEKNKIKKYEEDRGPFLTEAASSCLPSLLNNTTVLYRYAVHLMTPAVQCLKHVKAGIPKMIETDRQLYMNLQSDKRSKEEVKETYLRLKEDCGRLISELRKEFPKHCIDQPGKGADKAAH